MMVLALVILALAFCCSVCEEETLGLSTPNKTQIACAQLKASNCSHLVRWDLRCAQEVLTMTAMPKANRSGYQSFKAGKMKRYKKKHSTPPPRSRPIKAYHANRSGYQAGKMKRNKMKHINPPSQSPPTKVSHVMRPGYRSIKAGKVKISVKKHETRRSWDAALRVCRSEGGSLVKIDTEEKAAAIKKNFKIKSYSFVPAYLWIGLRYFKNSSMFFWTDKTSTQYEDWGPGQPHHTYKKFGQSFRIDCVALGNYMFLGTFWFDRPCKQRNGFICEAN